MFKHIITFCVIIASPKNSNKKLMKKLNFLFALLFLAGSASAQTWSLDKSHAQLGFNITHLLLSEVDGGFKTFDAKITSSKDDFSDAVIELTADVASIDTDNEDRDKHLRTPDFFDAEKFPKITFKSTSFKKVEGKKYKLVGDLTMHGVTKSVALDVVLNGPIVHPYNKKNVAGFKISGVIKRSDFGISPGTPGAVLSDEVSLDTNAEFVKD
jgi:polyisoprenoid-binding protein YceI